MSPSSNQLYIGGADLTSILYVARNVLLRFRNLPDESLIPKRTGGFLAILEETDRIYRFPLVVQIGECVPELEIRAQQYAQEKCRRLHRMWKKKGHISSRQSRFPEKSKYGGGIIKGNITGAFSGLTELEDEALITVIFIALGWINHKYAAKIISIGKNPFTKPLIDACSDIIETNWLKQ